MIIKFYIPKDEIIPTFLRLKIDDKYYVYYQMTNDGSWIFDFYGEAVNCWEELLNEIIRTMIYQSEDHNSRWEEVERLINDSDLKFGKITALVKFRVRDSY